MRGLKRYYLECGIELLPFSRDQKNWDQLLDVLEHLSQALQAKTPLALEEFHDMEELLDD